MDRTIPHLVVTRVAPGFPAATLPQGPVFHHAAPLGNSRIQYATSLPTPGYNDLTIATDPDHDSIWIAQAGGPLRQIELGVGEEPGDIAVGWHPTGAGFEEVAWVSLHGGGAVLAISLGAPAVMTATGPIARLPVCAQPRGIDVYPPEGLTPSVYVACSDGVLVTLDSQTNAVVSTLPLVDDLKDVVVIDSSTALVTQFRAANVLQVALATGAFVSAPLPGAPDRTADVAWQMVPTGSGSDITRTGALVAYQLASTAAIKVVNTCVCMCDDGTCATDAAGDCDDGTNCSECGSQNGYGPPPPGCASTDACEVGVVAAAAAIVLPSSDPGGLPVMLPFGMFASVVPPLTIATLPAPALGDQPVIVGLGNGAGVQIDFTQAGQPTTCVQSNAIVGPAASALEPSNGGLTLFVAQQGTTPGAINLDGDLTELPYQAIIGETGRDLFHGATPSLMSCASCHPNGRDDGHIWSFDPTGLRRTPSLGGGLLATAPYHWDGSELDISQLMTDVFVGRMQGAPPTADEISAISTWLDGLPVAYDHAAPDAASAARGQLLFQSPAVGCVSCHSGAHFTNNLTLDVGTGGSFQVPSLLGVGSRPPYLHDGRVATLVDRFGPGGGGDQHGQTSQLTAAQIDDLVAYLRTL